jgi:hypothetical protein
MGGILRLPPLSGPSSDEVRSRFVISSQFDAVEEILGGLFSVSLIEAFPGMNELD